MTAVTLQDYRYVRPHDTDQCPDCAPSGQGHPLCMAPGCDGLAMFQTVRHATQAEYDQLPEAWRPVDGIARKAVYACDDDDHADAMVMFCTHAEPKPPACPEPHCQAGIDEPCIRADGAQRKTHHAARAHQPAVYDRCIHAHREDCQIFTSCQCSTDDEPPARVPRSQPERDHADGSRSKLPADIVSRIVEAYDIPWWTVRHYATATAQDQTDAIDVVFATLDQDGNVVGDGHGHDLLQAVRIPLDPEAPRVATSIPVPAYAAAG